MRKTAESVAGYTGFIDSGAVYILFIQTYYYIVGRILKKSMILNCNNKPMY